MDFGMIKPKLKKFHKRSKTGSIALILPSKMVKALNIEAGTIVSIKKIDDRVIVEKAGNGELKQVYESGNSLALIFPFRIMNELDIKDRTSVIVSLEDQKIIIKKVERYDNIIN